MLRVPKTAVLALSVADFRHRQEPGYLDAEHPGNEHVYSLVKSVTGFWMPPCSSCQIDEQHRAGVGPATVVFLVSLIRFRGRKGNRDEQGFETPFLKARPKPKNRQDRHGSQDDCHSDLAEARSLLNATENRYISDSLQRKAESECRKADLGMDSISAPLDRGAVSNSVPST